MNTCLLVCKDKVSKPFLSVFVVLAFLILVPSNSYADQKMMGSQYFIDLIYKASEERCPKEFITYRALSAKYPGTFINNEADFWAEPHPRFEIWYNKLIQRVALTFLPLGDSFFFTTGWVLVTSDMVAIVSSMKANLDEIDRLSPHGNISRLLNKVEKQRILLEAATDLSLCLHPTEQEFRSMPVWGANFRKGMLELNMKIECHKFYELAHGMLKITENVDPVTLNAERQSLHVRVAGTCERYR